MFTPLPIHDALLERLTTDGSASRIDLARALRLARSTVSLRIAELIDAGLVEEYAEADSRGGRKARLLRIRGGSATVIALDISGHHYRSALVDAQGTYISTSTGSAPLARDPREGSDQLIKHLKKHIDSSGLEKAPSGICIGLPAPIHAEGRAIDLSARMPTWNGYPLADTFSDAFSVPVRLENDANLAAWGEHRAHPELRHSMTVKAGGGLGAGIVLNNALHTGATGAAGDISHVRHENYGNLPCSCGNTGCLATVASGDALTAQWKQLNGNAISLKDLITKANEENPVALGLFRTAGEHLGRALCEAVGLLNPEALFLTGSISSIEVFHASVRSALYAGCHPLATRTLRIERASQDDASLRGAALLATELISY